MCTHTEHNFLFHPPTQQTTARPYERFMGESSEQRGTQPSWRRYCWFRQNVNTVVAGGRLVGDRENYSAIIILQAAERFHRTQ